MTVHKQLLKAINSNKEQILDKSFLCIDPSSGSRESMPAFAIFKAGELVRADEIRVPEKLLKGMNYTPHRLQWIANELRRKFPKPFKLLVLECFYYRPNRNTNLRSFQQLNQSVGAIESALQWRKILQVLAFEWAKYKPIGYVKSDINDAIQIGKFVIEQAKILDGQVIDVEHRDVEDEAMFQDIVTKLKARKNNK